MPGGERRVAARTVFVDAAVRNVAPGGTSVVNAPKQRHVTWGPSIGVGPVWG